MLDLRCRLPPVEAEPGYENTIMLNYKTGTVN